VEAILDLLKEGHPRPTAQQVSDRSGISIRSIFRLFDDMESLHRLAVDRQLALVRPLFVDLPVEGSVGERVAALVENRAEVYEVIAPVRRSGINLASRSPAIRRGLTEADRFCRRQLADVFAPELSLSGAAPELLDALDAATSWETWERLRSPQGLSPARAGRTMALTVTALLTASEPS